MLIGEAAAIAGTTARAVRHYHRLGLLAEPARRANGYRHYELADIVRLLRIRWLATSGLPLGAVRAVLDRADDDDVAADLDDLIGGIDAQLADLADRRQRLTDMRESHRHGMRLTPLPSTLAAVLDEIAAGEDDPAVRDLIERERAAWELLALTGRAPAGTFDVAEAALKNPESRARVVGLYRRFAALAAPGVTPDEIGVVGDELAALLAETPPPHDDRDGDPSSMSADTRERPAGPRPWPTADAAHTEPLLYELVPDSAQRAAVVHALAVLRPAGDGDA